MRSCYAKKKKKKKIQHREENVVREVMRGLHGHTIKKTMPPPHHPRDYSAIVMYG